MHTRTQVTRTLRQQANRIRRYSTMCVCYIRYERRHHDGHNYGRIHGRNYSGRQSNRLSHSIDGNKNHADRHHADRHHADRHQTAITFFPELTHLTVDHVHLTAEHPNIHPFPSFGQHDQPLQNLEKLVKELTEESIELLFN